MTMVSTHSTPADRIFSPDSLFWQINREGLMVLSGPRALLLELAHPLVAQGVVDHSNFRARPLGRLFRTVGVMTSAYGLAQVIGPLIAAALAARPDAIGVALEIAAATLLLGAACLIGAALPHFQPRFEE